MKNKLNTALGFYTPSFMRMHVGTDLSLIDYRNLNDNYTESVFLHEFTHFIQDITTVYGLTNICVVVDYMKFVNNDVLKSAVGPFDVPVLPLEGGDDNVFANLELNNIYNGDGDDDYVTFKNHIITKGNVNTKDKVVDPVIIEISYEDEDGLPKNFNFGALCILENMAYIIEGECYSDCELSPDIPYSAAEKLVELIYPNLGTNRLNILALCDASLQVHHPAEFFYHLLLKMKEEKVLFTTPEEVYAYSKTLIKKDVDLDLLLRQQADMAIFQLKGYFNDPYFDSLKNWLEYMINRAVDFRLKNPFFPLDIARGKALKTNKEFRNFFLSIGTPLITNNLGAVYLYDPNNSSAKLNYPIIWAINQINQVFWGYQRHCELKDVCRAGKFNVDSRCDTSPWDRVIDENLCPFATVWRHWKLAGYYPI
ncbi:hypothetical protein [Flavobacterium sp.]|uniref:hypothetical protein n=1 Tax=Flavobacterium sp. TaxID=239 RepID=UPI00286AAB4B|nr:hypothetical protein [Flavobacterium sp.]